MLPRTTNNISEGPGCDALMGRLICINAGLQFDWGVVTQGWCEWAKDEESLEDYWAYLHYRHHVDHLSQWSAKIIIEDDFNLSRWLQIAVPDFNKPHTFQMETMASKRARKNWHYECWKYLAYKIIGLYLSFWFAEISDDEICRCLCKR